MSTVCIEGACGHGRLQITDGIAVAIQDAMSKPVSPRPKLRRTSGGRKTQARLQDEHQQEVWDFARTAYKNCIEIIGLQGGPIRWRTTNGRVEWNSECITFLADPGSKLVLPRTEETYREFDRLVGWLTVATIAAHTIS